MKAPNLHLLNAAREAKMQDLPDDQLMCLVMAERQDALAELVRRYQSLVIGFSSRFLGQAQEGKEVAQDVFLSLWADRQRYQERGRFRAYLMTLALNRCRVVARNRRNTRKKLECFQTQARPEERAESSALDRLVEAEQSRVVRQHLQELPESVREVMVLRFVNELKMQEIADVTGKPLGTVKVYVLRGVEHLTNRLLEAKP